MGGDRIDRAEDRLRAAALLDWVKQAEVDAGNVLVWPQPRRNAPRVEPICRVLRIAPSAYRLHAARSRDPSKRGALGLAPAETINGLYKAEVIHRRTWKLLQPFTDRPRG